MKKKVQRSPQALLKELRSLSTLDMEGSSKPIGKDKKDISSSLSSPAPLPTAKVQGKKDQSLLELKLALGLARHGISRKVSPHGGEVPGEGEGLDLTLLSRRGNREVDLREKEEKKVDLVLKPKKKGDLASRPKRKTLGRQPHASPPTMPSPSRISHAISQDPTVNILIPEDPHQRERAISSYLTKLQVLALGKAEQTLKCSTDIPAHELVKLASMLKDLQLTVKWTRKLEQAILENASRLTPPGIGKMGLLSKLKLLAGGVQKEQKNDGRQSGLKRGQSILEDLDVPKDDPENKVAGA